MEKHKCKLCFKSFVNGRALGGHMRSHVLNQYVTPKIEELSESLCQYTDSSSSSESEEENEEDHKDYVLRENPKKGIRFIDPEFHSTSMVLQDRESETESSRNLTRRQSKRIRNWEIKNSHNQTSKEVCKSESEPASSISDTTPAEDVAYCLMMMSRDEWKMKKGEKDETSSNDLEYKSNNSGKIQSKYKCETCDRVFKSYQALGGHRASHKKIKAYPSEFPPLMMDVSIMAAAKIHECPVCFRVFGSGQALGGHKRSHVASSLSTNTPVTEIQVGRKNVEKLIDLNLPAPIDDDEISQVEVSAVSDGEFVK